MHRYPYQRPLLLRPAPRSLICEAVHEQDKPTAVDQHCVEIYKMVKYIYMSNMSNAHPYFSVFPVFTGDDKKKKQQLYIRGESEFQFFTLRVNGTLSSNPHPSSKRQNIRLSINIFQSLEIRYIYTIHSVNQEEYLRVSQMLIYTNIFDPSSCVN